MYTWFAAVRLSLVKVSRRRETEISVVYRPERAHAGAHEEDEISVVCYESVHVILAL
jgi:hypothetical protein